MRTKENTIQKWLTAFVKNKSYWGRSVHIDALVGEKRDSMYYFNKSIELFKEFIDQGIELSLLDKHVLSLYIYLTESYTLNKNILYKDIVNIMDYTPPEFFILDKHLPFKSGVSEHYEKPVFLPDNFFDDVVFDKKNFYSYYVCYRGVDEKKYTRYFTLKYRIDDN